MFHSRSIWLIFPLWFCSQNIYAQIVDNGDFEEYMEHYQTYKDSNGMLNVDRTKIPAFASAWRDYKFTSESNLYDSVNHFVKIAWIDVCVAPLQKNYLLLTLNESLLAGQEYILRLKCRIDSNYDCSLPIPDNLGFTFSTSQLDFKSPKTDNLNTLPSPVKDTGFIFRDINSIKSNEWHQVECRFKANGDEKSLIFGLLPVDYRQDDILKLTLLEVNIKKYNRTKRLSKQKSILKRIKSLVPYWNKSDLDDDAFVKFMEKLISVECRNLVMSIDDIEILKL